MSGMYKPSGNLQGDDKAMPNRGTGTGMNPNTELDGASIDRDATNRRGGMGGAARSTPADKNMPTGDK